MSVTLNGTSGLVFSDGTVQGTAAGMPFRNRIINGDMRIDQRRNGGSVTPSTSEYTLDRWLANINVTGSRYSIQQSTNAPSGFTHSLLATSTSAYTLVASDYSTIQQRIEANNISDVAWGTAAAKTMTLSFWVRSSLTGTFGGSLYLAASTTRTYPYSYIISAANTWEYKTITIPGDTFSNTMPTTNNVYVIVQWALGVGSAYTTSTAGWQSGNFARPTGCVNVLGTNGATFQLTGVQFEKAAAATDFEFRPYATELAMCQRYFYNITPGSNYTGWIATWSNGYARVSANHPVIMRTAPSMTFGGSTGSGDWFSTNDDSNYRNFGSPVSSGTTDKTFVIRMVDNGGGIGTPAAGTAYMQNGRTFFVNAEL